MERNITLEALVEQAQAAADLLAAMANPNRLLVLCHLATAGEISVGRLADTIGISQSALSQHLAKLRNDGLVETRKDRQTVYYRLHDPRVLSLLLLLRDQFCPTLPTETRPGS